MARYLQIAAAGFFALLAVALIGLWVRSYDRQDSIFKAVSDGSYISGGSFRGLVFFELVRLRPGLPPLRNRTWRIRSEPFIWPDLNDHWNEGILHGLGFQLNNSPDRFFAAVPHWFLITLGGLLAMAIALNRKRQFSLRMLLIATTLIAGVLGLMVYSL
jgi:hypothetical protein